MFLPHAKAVADNFGEKGIESVVVCCKIGALKLRDIGLTENLGYRYHLCNPAGQAFLMNMNETEMNVLLGLCAQHDMIVNWHSKAPCTTLFVKEHITNHAPFSSIATLVEEKCS